MEALRALAEKLSRPQTQKLIGFLIAYMNELAKTAVTFEGDRIVVAGPILEGEIRIKDPAFAEALRRWLGK